MKQASRDLMSQDGKYGENRCEVMGGARTQCCNQPDACNERRNTVYRAAIMRQQVTNTATDGQQAAVSAREYKHAALARAVVSQRNLRQQRH